jgi:hypothetical protein
VKKQVIRPFEYQRLSRHRNVDRLDEGKSRRQRQRLRLRVAGAQLDDRASVEIPRRGDPLASLAAPARLLLKRDEPVAFLRGRFSDEIGVGRAGSLDETDAAQKSVPAARSVTAPKGPISK